MNLEEHSLEHYGTPRHSGRYPWGSGKDPQRSKDFLQRVKELRDEGYSEKERAEALGMNTAQLRAKISKETANLKSANVAEAAKLYAKGVSKSEISRRLGVPISTVSTYLDPSQAMDAKGSNAVAEVLKDQLKSKPYLNTTKGANLYLGVTEDRMKKALKNLEEEGCSINEVYVEQLGTGKRTTLRILSEPGVSKKEAWEHRYDIQPVDGDHAHEQPECPDALFAKTKLCVRHDLCLPPGNSTLSRIQAFTASLPEFPDHNRHRHSQVRQSGEQPENHAVKHAQ